MSSRTPRKVKQDATEGTPRPRKRLATEERRAQLLEHGIQAFSQLPYDAVSIDDVAARAEISKGLLYHYFPTKRDFYVAAIEEVSGRLLRATDFSHEPLPLARLANGLDAYMRFVETHGLAYAALLRSGIGMDQETLDVIERTRTTFVERLVEGIGRSLSPVARVAMRGWIGFVEATSLDWVAHRSVDRDVLIGLWSRTLITLSEPFLAEPS